MNGIYDVTLTTFGCSDEATFEEFLEMLDAFAWRYHWILSAFVEGDEIRVYAESDGVTPFNLLGDWVKVTDTQYYIVAGRLITN
jgi:hypothetical protein